MLVGVDDILGVGIDSVGSTLPGKKIQQGSQLCVFLSGARQSINSTLVFVSFPITASAQSRCPTYCLARDLSFVNQVFMDSPSIFLP